jgi:hypothetical protein
MFNKKTAPWWIGIGALILIVAVVLGIGSFQQAAENGKSPKKRSSSNKKAKGK